MYEDFFSKRLAQLRLEKNVSARDMSLSLGQSESYINKIENGKAFPSMQVFFYICEYLKISPMEFFNAAQETSSAQQRAIEQIYAMPEKDVLLLLSFIDRMNGKTE